MDVEQAPLMCQCEVKLTRSKNTTKYTFPPSKENNLPAWLHLKIIPFSWCSNGLGWEDESNIVHVVGTFTWTDAHHHAHIHTASAHRGSCRLESWVLTTFLYALLLQIQTATIKVLSTRLESWFIGLILFFFIDTVHLWIPPNIPFWVEVTDNVVPPDVAPVHLHVMTCLFHITSHLFLLLFCILLRFHSRANNLQLF